jgi:NAD(P)-dependent dehydrogenase (short-subunit alcohol dehydrogenase family)
MSDDAGGTKVVLVTGASSGIGKATALRLLHDGHKVYGAARRVDRMQDIVEAGGHALQLDVTAPGLVNARVQQILLESGHIDVVVNNAGYAVYGAVENVELDEARRQFEVNLFGVAAVTQAVLPPMRKQGRGAIVNVSSMGGKVYTPLGAWYHASKHALEGWSDCLRLELEPFGIDVILIEPGLIATEFSEVLHEPLLDRSAGGPYESVARAVAKGARSTGRKGGASSPSVVADLISKAIVAEKPKTRYAGGKYAKLLMWIRKWLGDRFFDWIMRSRMNRMRDDS